MVLNKKSLLKAAPIKNMLDHKEHTETSSYGLAEAGYDIRLKQEICYRFDERGIPYVLVDGIKHYGHFTLASAIEEFQMPDNLVGVVHDKSTWARKGVAVNNTVVEAGWKGYLTLEITFNGSEEVTLPKGCGIAQVVFSELSDSVSYDGKYQNQEDKPVSARMDKEHF